MASWLVLTAPDKPLRVIDAESAEAACIRAARHLKRPGEYMAVEWNPTIVKVARNVSESWAVSP